MRRATSPHRKATIAMIVACITTGWLIWCAGSAFSSPPADLSPGLQEVVKLAQAHMGDDVILAYVKNSGASYSLTADDILYLKEQGVSQNVIATLLQSKSADAPPSPPPAPPVPTPAPAPSEAPPEVGGGESTAAPAAAPAPEPVVNFDYFQQQLSPYGNWIDVPGYGQCWQPNALPPGWRPYYDSGYWVDTDAGLYWQSSYPWGAIPFHYGRWAYAGGYGWIWVPAYEYAPAWVLWRHNDGYVGWAPLPYGAVWVSGGWWDYRGARVGVDFDFGLGASFFVFVDYHHMWEHDYHPYVLHREDLHRVYRESTVNRFGRDDHGRFVAEGFDREHLERLTGRKVEVVRHEEIQSREREALRVDRERVVHHESTAEPRRESRPSEPKQGASENKEHSDKDSKSEKGGRPDKDE